jgi:hypothetical protein
MNATRFRRIAGTLVVTASLVMPAFAVVSLNASAQTATDGRPYSHSKLNQLIRDAHTPSQYQALADYFRSQETMFRNKAAAEKVEWERRQAVASESQLKFPAPADSSRSLYEYYTYKADKMATRAAAYEQRAR